MSEGRWWQRRYERVLRVSDSDRDLEEELRFHLEMKAAELEAAGMSPDEASVEARRLFGDVPEVREECRSVDADIESRKWLRGMLDALTQDLAYGLRSVRRAPWLSAVAMLTLALGIGATTAAWSVVNTVLLRLPVADPTRVVELTEMWDYGALGYNAPRNLQDYEELTDVFERLAPFYADSRAPVVLERDESRRVVPSLFASAELLPVLGVEPALGRGFVPEEDELGAPPVAIVSHEFWLSELGGDPEVLGTSVTFGINNWSDLPQELRPPGYRPGYQYRSFTVVGVLPEGFELPPLQLANGASHGELGRSQVLSSGLFVARPDVLLPYGLYSLLRDRRGFSQIRALGLLAEGIDVESGEAALNRLAPGIDRTEVRLTTVRALQRRVYGDRLAMLSVAAAFLLLVSCANVAGLLLARGARRERECAVRASLGAGRGRLVRQMLTETGLIAAAGCVAGIVLAHGGTTLLASLAPDGGASVAEAALVDGRVLAGAIGVSIFALLLAGVVPAVHSARPDLYAALGSGGSTPSRSRRRLLRWIAVTQLATSTVLLVGTGLFYRSLLEVSRVDPGIRVDNILTARLELLPRETSAYPSPRQAAAMLAELVQRVEALPGVASVEQVGVETPTFWDRQYVVPYSKVQSGTGESVMLPEVFEQRVSPGYFALLGTELRAGRVFTVDDDVRGTRQVPNVIINESMARRHWPEGDALGSQIRWGPPDSQYPPLRIVGIVEDMRFPAADAHPPNQIFYPVRGGFVATIQPKVDLLVETRTDPAVEVAAVRDALGGSESGEPHVAHVLPLRSVLSDAVAPRRFQALLAGVAAGTTLIIALLGLFSVISYSVERRTHETGLRKALGAPEGTIVRAVVAEGLQLAVLGLALGAVGATALTRVIESELFGVAALDPVTYTAVGLAMLVSACLAAWVPAWRAGALDPVDALRSD